MRIIAGSVVMSVLLLSAGGCSGKGQGSRVDEVEVNGTVKWDDGSPVVNAELTLIPTQGGESIGGGMISEGQISDFQAPEGEYTVIISPPVASDPASGGENSIPQVYQDPKKSPLKVTVKKGQPLDITLKRSGG